MSDTAHVATLGTGPLTESLWFAQLLIAFLFAAGFIHYYRQLWRFVCHWHSSKLGFRWVARVLVAIVAISIGTWLHMVGWRVFTNASGLMFHNMGLFVLTFILLDTHITWWEYGLRVLGVLNVWQMHHTGYFARPQFALSLAGAALGLVVIWHWREQIRYRTWPRIGAYLYLGVCFWTLLPPHSAGLTITPPIIIQALSMYLVMVVVTAAALGKEHRIDVQNATNAQLAQYDQLTNAKSAAIFRRDVTRYFQAAQAANQQLTVAAIDIDHFKQINDHYGHLVGDDVLIGVANTIARALRTDAGHHALYRTGGEEFAIVFQDTPIKSVQAIVEGVWHAVQKQRFEAGEYGIHTTLSIGVAELVATDTRFDDLYARADADLYQSKHNGRNAITINGNTLNNHTTQHVMATRTLITQNVLHVEDIARPVAQEVLLARYEYDHDRWNFPTVFVVPLLVQLNYVSELLAAGVCDEIMLHLTAAQFARNETITQMLEFQRAHPALRQWVVELDHQIELMPLAAWAPRYRQAGIKIAMINIDAQQSMTQFASHLPYLDILKMTCAGMRERFPNGIDDQHFASWQHQAGNLPLVFIITGIENSVDADYAKRVLKADYLQGYYYDRPELPRLA